jgi:predicted phage tail protein
MRTGWLQIITGILFMAFSFFYASRSTFNSGFFFGYGVCMLFWGLRELNREKMDNLPSMPIEKKKGRQCKKK